MEDKKQNLFVINSSKTVSINSSTSTFQLQSLSGIPIPGIQDYYSKLNQLGMHYHFVAIDQDGKPFKNDGIVVKR